MKVANLKISEVKPYKSNPRINDDAIEIVAKSLEEFGFQQPLVLDKNKEIIVGHTRLLAAKNLKLETVPCVIAENLSDEKIKAYRIMDNKSAQYASWNYGLLTKELQDLLDSSYDLDFTGFTEEEISELDLDFGLEEFEPPIDEDEVPEVDFSIVEENDIWILDKHKLYCGDCTNEESYKILLDDVEPNMVFTDPPYGINYEYNTHKDQEGDEYLQFCDKWFSLLQKYAPSFIFLTAGWKYNNFWLEKNPTDIFYWLSRNKQSGGKLSHFRKVEPIFLWGKNKNKYNLDFFDFNSDRLDGLRDHHTCPKPVRFVEEALTAFDKNSIVLDTFVGSGTTIIAAEKRKQICYAMEIDPTYCDVVIERWQQYTGKKAYRLHDEIYFDDLKENQKDENEAIAKADDLIEKELQ